MQQYGRCEIAFILSINAFKLWLSETDCVQTEEEKRRNIEDGRLLVEERVLERGGRDTPAVCNGILCVW